jgi:hypothetical protein
MKAVLGSLLVAVLGVSTLAGEQAGKKTGNDSVKGPRIEIAPESHDFGKVKQNQKLDKEFELKNVGTEDLVLGRISTSCGCTAALTSKKTLKPGESTSLKVTFETRRYKGAVQRSVSIASNDPRRVRTLRVKAFVEAAANAPKK